MNQLRPPQTISGLSTSPDIPLQISRPIRFRHPGYSEPNLLLMLFGFDSAQGSLHHETARLACALVANNRWDGYLSETPSGPPITVPPNGLLDKMSTTSSCPCSSVSSTLACSLPPHQQRVNVYLRDLQRPLTTSCCFFKHPDYSRFTDCRHTTSTHFI